MPAIPQCRPWLAATLAATVAVTVFGAAAGVASAADAAASAASASAPTSVGLHLTADQVRALSAKYTVGVGATGTIAQRVGLAQAAAAGVSADPTKSAAPSAPAAGPAGNQSTNQSANQASTSGLSFTADQQIETARGLGLTAAVPGSDDWIHVDTSGQVQRVGRDGKPVWTKTEQGLAADWGLKGTVPYLPEPPPLDMFAGYDPISGTGVSSDQTFAVGDFGGGSGDDIAVAYTLGASAAFPFTVPDSPLTHYASFVTVIDGRTGKTLWHQVYPGDVNRLAAGAGGLIVGDVTGPMWSVESAPSSGESRTGVSLVKFHKSGAAVTGTTSWTYNTQVPWAALATLTPTADGIATGWTDTPMGLGTPRPADGHVILLDAATGKLKLDVPTPGYPRIIRDDPERHRLVVAEENDPEDAVSWQLTAIDPRSGARQVLATRTGTFVTTLRVADTGQGNANHKNPAYVATELTLDMSGSQPVPVNSSVLSFDAHGKNLWTTPIPAAFAGDAPVVGGTVLPDADKASVVVTTQDPQNPTEAVPNGPEGTQILSFDARTGKLRWRQAGAVGTGLEPAQWGDRILSVAADQTAYAYKISNGAPVAVQPQLGDLYAGVLVPGATTARDGVKNIVAAGQSRGVFLLDGHSQPNGVPKVLWSATVQGAVHHAELVDDGKQVLVAATGGWDLIDVATGKVKVAKDVPGAYTWSVTAAGTGKNTEIIDPTRALTAYGLNGRQLWTFKPAGSAVKFSNATVDADGHVIAEYATAAGDKAPKYGVVSVDARTGKTVWDLPADPSVLSTAPLDAVYASPDIPGADGHGVALAWAASDGSPAGTTRVEVRDSRTGAVLTSHTGGGSTTNIDFSADPSDGLAWYHFAVISRLLPDGKTWTDTGMFSDTYSGGFATSTGGSTVLLDSPFGASAYDPALFDGNNDYPMQAAQTGPLDDAHQLVIDGSQVLGLQQDVREWGINSEWMGSYYFDYDQNMHGLTVSTLTGTLKPGAAPKPAPKPQLKAAAPTPQTAPLTTPVLDPTGGGLAPDSILVNPDPNTPNAPNAPATLAAAPPIRGYTPAQIQHNLALKGDGSGQTVAIVDAYHHPALPSDLNVFSKQFGLPPTCDGAAAGADCFDFSVDTMPGTTVDGGGWDGEAALDVEWVHAVAPHAKIVLVEAQDPSMQHLNEAVDAAAALHPAAVSMSWGMNREFSGESFYDNRCLFTDTVCVESAGDSGNPDGYSATSPNVLSIGGTTLKLDAAGNTVSQTAWRGTGGGLSVFEKRPAYQDGANPDAHRGTPDVSAVADPQTGVAVYYTDVTQGSAGWGQIGGTSLSAPIWSAILASADQARAALGKPHLASADGSVFRDIYGLGSALVDVTSGSNGACPPAECSARAGYDTVTGLGTPGPGVDQALAAKP
ncbi:outer membrane protein assembly factor BamB family protein [Catenulispora pinisilvae]|uniref:outer membrane protein assembly factor BamB family protein n=1 Tax=Catenulispora pinisilvae TaxID=2705253 RepID=UPI001892419F|nr:PQQ-binding-like beta-propeller repeat protein [Catenulispora pinisilvae]